MKNFAAIDFETANHYPQSICSVGVVVVKQGEVAEKFYELIRPTPNFYNHHNTLIHRISVSDTVSAPRFPEVWARIVPLIEGLPLVAHNSPFDAGCLRAAHAHYEMEWPEYNFLCTCRLSRRAFPKLSDHKLSTVAAHIGFNFNHHHALEDAEACAAIARKILLG